MAAQDFQNRGYLVVDDAISESACDEIISNLPSTKLRSGGTRIILDEEWCGQVISALRANPVVASLLPPDAIAVQCTYFQKSRDVNWFVPLHQDLSIPVQERVEHSDLSGWSRKEGQLFVQAPITILESLVAVRLHLDRCGPDDGALAVLAGSHTCGRVLMREIAERKVTFTEHLCVAEKGGLLVFRPLLLHRSSKTAGDSLRRVLHFLFGPAELPYGLKWAQS